MTFYEFSDDRSNKNEEVAEEDMASFLRWVEKETIPPKPRDPDANEVSGPWICGGHYEAYWFYDGSSKTWTVQAAERREAISNSSRERARWTLENLPQPLLPKDRSTMRALSPFWYEQHHFCWVLPINGARWQLAVAAKPITGRSRQ